MADGPCLVVPVGASEEQPGGGARRSHDHPPLRTATFRRQRRRVLDQLEAQDVNEERDCGVVVLDDQGNLLEMHDTKPSTRTRRSREVTPV
jgi:hypothetical protein